MPTSPNAYYSSASGKGVAIGVGDFNRDGYPDVALGTRTGSCTGKIEIWFNNGAGVFSQGYSYLASGEVNAVAVADFDGDSWPDVAVGTKTATNDKTGRVEVWINKANDHRFVQKGPWTSGGKVNALAAGSMDAGGTVDLVAGTQTGAHSGQVELWLNDGTGTMTLSDAATTDQVALCVAVGPIDLGNSSNDIVVGTSNQRVQVWFCDPSAGSPANIVPTYESWGDANVGGTVTALAVGKVEAPWTAPSSDLLNDIICGTAVTSTTGEIVIYLNPYVWTLAP